MMLLQNATKNASVDLFYRFLEFDFQSGGLTGSRGGLILPKYFPSEERINKTDQYRDEDLPILLHELEHLVCLQYPLGVFFSAFAYRLNDQINELAKNWNKYLQSKRRSTFEAKKTIAPTLSSAFRLFQMRANLLTTIYFITPLLEGLALLSELEIDCIESPPLTYSWLYIIALEEEYVRQLLMLLDVKTLETLNDHQILNDFRKDLMFKFSSLLKRGRQKRRRGLLFKDLFFSNIDDEFPGSKAPYFFGYLFLKKLLNCWQKLRPNLELEDFYRCAVRWVCEVLPITLLPAYNLPKIEGYKTLVHWRILSSLYKEFIENSLRYRSVDIDLLLHEDQLIFWNQSLKKLTPITNSHDIYFPLKIIEHLFEVEDDEIEKYDYNFEIIKELSELNNIIRLIEESNIVIAVDDTTKSLLLLKILVLSDEGRLVIKYSKSYSCFILGDRLDEFFKRTGHKKDVLGTFRLGHPPFKVPTPQDLILVKLISYLYLCPSCENEPLKIVRLLAYKEDFGFIESTAHEKLGEILKFRSKVEYQFLPRLRSIISEELNYHRQTCYECMAIFENDELPFIISKEILKMFPYDIEKEIRDSSLKTYSKSLFPAVNDDRIALFSDKKFGLLKNVLSPDDSARLLRFLRKGLALSRDGGYLISRDHEDQGVLRSAIERIRNAAVKEFGCFLIAFNENTEMVEFDFGSAT